MDSPLRFFVGMHMPNHCHHFERCFVSINRIRDRKSPFPVNEWVLDSGAFTQIATHGRFIDSIEDYAAQIKRWSSNGNLRAAVAQDYMCEPWMVEKTGLTVRRHQELTIERYDALMAADTGAAVIMPVLQGYRPEEYREHLSMYGDRLAAGHWVGVGSVCKRNSRPRDIHHVLSTIHQERGDLKLHGFGLKITALRDPEIVRMLHSADSLAWSFAARRAGGGQNDWREAAAYVAAVGQPIQSDQIQGSLTFI